MRIEIENYIGITLTGKNSIIKNS